MKVLIVVVVALMGVGAHAKVVAPYVPIITGDEYHEKIGIPEAERIRLAEEQMLSDPSRIVGGGASGAGANPHHCGVLITHISGATSICGGALVTNTRSLTAAHCWASARELTVVFGSQLLYSGGTRIITNNVQNHFDYNPGNLHHDISIILHSYVGFNNVIQPANLPTDNLAHNNFVGWTGTASGFGRTSDNQVIGNNQFLSHIIVPVITNAECVQYYGNNIIDSSLCTSGANGRGTCGGDSGGPLVITSGNQRFLIGLSSFNAQAGCQAGLPSAFSRVTSYLSWILARL